MSYKQLKWWRCYNSVKMGGLLCISIGIRMVLAMVTLHPINAINPITLGVYGWTKYIQPIIWEPTCLPFGETWFFWACSRYSPSNGENINGILFNYQWDCFMTKYIWKSSHQKTKIRCNSLHNIGIFGPLHLLDQLPN